MRLYVFPVAPNPTKVSLYLAEKAAGGADYFRAALPAALRVLDQRLADGRAFLAGERPSIADCTLAETILAAPLATAAR